LWKNYLGSFCQRLDFSNSELSSNETKYIAICCPNIEYLDLRDTKITDDSLPLMIECCKNLKEIDVTNTLITSAGVALLKKSIQTVVY
jgi:hypothetical protein